TSPRRRAGSPRDRPTTIPRRARMVHRRPHRAPAPRRAAVRGAQRRSSPRDRPYSRGDRRARAEEAARGLAVRAPPQRLTRPGMTATGPGLLWTRNYVTTVVATCLVFVSVGVTIPLLPVVVTRAFGGSELAVGLVFGASACAAIAARPC